MKKLMFVFVMALSTISFGSVTAQDASLPGDDPGLMQAALQQVKNKAGEVIGTQCVHCDATGTCWVLLCN
jgi:hypothetical protein